MLFYVFLLVFIIVIIGRYKIVNDYALMPQKMAYLYIETLLIIIAVLRFNVGFDFKNYYNLIVIKYLENEVRRFELIPRVLLNFAYKRNSPVLFFITCGIPIYIFIFKAIKDNSVSRYESFLIYICVFFLESLGTVRQWLAMAILFYSFKYLRTKKKLPYILCCIIAFYCHKSSIIASIFVYLIYNYGEVKLYYPLCFGTIFFGKKILLLLGNLGVFGSYIYYLRVFDTMKNTGGEKTKFFFLLIWFFCYCFHKRIPNNRYIKKLLRVCAFGLIFPFILGGHLGARLGEYFYIYLILLIPEILEGNYFIRQYRKIFMVLFYLYFIFFLYINHKNSGNSYIPYRFYPIEKVYSETPKIK